MVMGGARARRWGPGCGVGARVRRGSQGAAWGPGYTVLRYAGSKSRYAGLSGKIYYRSMVSVFQFLLLIRVNASIGPNFRY